MSKLDDMFDEVGIINGQHRPDTAEEMRAILRPAIKKLILELLPKGRIKNLSIENIRKEVEKL